MSQPFLFTILQFQPFLHALYGRVGHRMRYFCGVTQVISSCNLTQLTLWFESKCVVI